MLLHSQHDSRYSKYRPIPTPVQISTGKEKEEEQCPIQSNPGITYPPNANNTPQRSLAEALHFSRYPDLDCWLVDITSQKYIKSSDQLPRLNVLPQAPERNSGARQVHAELWFDIRPRTNARV